MRFRRSYKKALRARSDASSSLPSPAAASPASNLPTKSISKYIRHNSPVEGRLATTAIGASLNPSSSPLENAALRKSGTASLGKSSRNFVRLDSPVNTPMFQSNRTTPSAAGTASPQSTLSKGTAATNITGPMPAPPTINPIITAMPASSKSPEVIVSKKLVRSRNTNVLMRVFGNRKKRHEFQPLQQVEESHAADGEVGDHAPAPVVAEDTLVVTRFIPLREPMKVAGTTTALPLERAGALTAFVSPEPGGQFRTNDDRITSERAMTPEDLLMNMLPPSAARQRRKTSNKIIAPPSLRARQSKDDDEDDSSHASDSVSAMPITSLIVPSSMTHTSSLLSNSVVSEVSGSDLHSSSGMGGHSPSGMGGDDYIEVLHAQPGVDRSDLLRSLSSQEYQNSSIRGNHGPLDPVQEQDSSPDSNDKASKASGESSKRSRKRTDQQNGQQGHRQPNAESTQPEDPKTDSVLLQTLKVDIKPLKSSSSSGGGDSIPKSSTWLQRSRSGQSSTTHPQEYGFVDEKKDDGDYDKGGLDHAQHRLDDDSQYRTVEKTMTLDSIEMTASEVRMALHSSSSMNSLGIHSVASALDTQAVLAKLNDNAEELPASCNKQEPIKATPIKDRKSFFSFKKTYKDALSAVIDAAPAETTTAIATVPDIKLKPSRSEDRCNTSWEESTGSCTLSQSIVSNKSNESSTDQSSATGPTPNNKQQQLRLKRHEKGFEVMLESDAALTVLDLDHNPTALAVGTLGDSDDSSRISMRVEKLIRSLTTTQSDFSEPIKAGFQRIDRTMSQESLMIECTPAVQPAPVLPSDGRDSEMISLRVNDIMRSLSACTEESAHSGGTDHDDYDGRLESGGSVATASTNEGTFTPSQNEIFEISSGEYSTGDEDDARDDEESDEDDDDATNSGVFDDDGSGSDQFEGSDQYGLLSLQLKCCK